MEGPRPAVVICEAGLRDGLQSISRTLPADGKLERIRRAHGAGLRAIEVGASGKVATGDVAYLFASMDEPSGIDLDALRRAGLSTVREPM